MPVICWVNGTFILRGWTLEISYINFYHYLFPSTITPPHLYSSQLITLIGLLNITYMKLSVIISCEYLFYHYYFGSPVLVTTWQLGETSISIILVGCSGIMRLYDCWILTWTMDWPNSQGLCHFRVFNGSLMETLFSCHSIPGFQITVTTAKPLI